MAAGAYEAPASHQLFVVDQANGTWDSAEEMPGTASRDKNGWAMLDAVPGAPQGSCSAGGFCTDGSGPVQAFVASQPSGA